MNTNSIFTVDNEDLSRLDQNTSVDFFRKLLWAEARRLGIELSKINVSSMVNVPDGGVDATVDDAQINNGMGIIKQGKTCYQIKSGTEFKPWRKSAIKKELFDSKTPECENLGESIKNCLDVDGTYVLVCTGIDPVESQRASISTNIHDFLNLCGYANPKIEVFTQDTLIGFLESFPSLSLSLNGSTNAVFQTHESWSLNDTMKKNLVTGKDQKNFITKIRRKLRTNEKAIHIRILGESGLGKTKLVHRITRVKDLSPLVIYCESSQFREDTNLMNQILRDDNHFAIILIVDDCDSRMSSEIWNKLKNRGSRIKLITINNDYEESAGDLTPEIVPALKEEQIQKILTEEYQIPASYVHRWSEFCGGLPGVAHMIGNNLQSNNENLLAPTSTANFWDRCVVGDLDTNRQEADYRWLVIQHIALFKQFGFKDSVSKEVKMIASIIEDTIPIRKFNKIVKDLIKRGILKGNYTLHITPKVLHIKLWIEWWENYYDEDFNLFRFTQPLTSELKNWFFDMFKYASESDEALKVVKSFLSPNGVFKDIDDFNTRLGSRFFLALTEADPKSALGCLRRIIGNSDIASLQLFSEGRRDIIWALEKIVMHRSLFPDASRLLLKLGEAENENYSNNASGVFAGLFSLGYGEVAPTEASPTERFPILREAFESGSKEQRILALKACDAGLETDNFSRSSGAERQGLPKEFDYWNPKTYGELYEAYCQVWKILSDQLDLLHEDEREEALAILLKNAPRIARIPYLRDMVIDTIRSLMDKKYVDKLLLLKMTEEFLHYEGKELSDDERIPWQQLREELMYSDFHSQLQRYVGMSLLIDEFDEDDNYLKHGHPKIQSLAEQVVETPKLLEPELQWLVTGQAQNGKKFGYELGKRDNGFQLLPLLLNAQRDEKENASESFLGGYFRAIFDHSVEEWEKQLDKLVMDTELNKIILGLTYHSGLTDKAALRLIKHGINETSDIINFQHFVSGNAIDNLSDEVFRQLIKFLLDYKDAFVISVALKLFFFFYVHGKQKPDIPFDLTFKLLCIPALDEKLNPNQLNSMTETYWTEIGTEFIRKYPDRSLEILPFILNHFGKKDTIFGRFKSKTTSVLTELTKHHPQQIWKQVTKYLNTQKDFLKTLSFEQWLREADLLEVEKEKGAISLIPQEEIWQWIDEDLEGRGGYVAFRLIPKSLQPERWENSLMREVLIRYGEREDVRRNLRANPMEMWTGDTSTHLDRKRKNLIQIQKTDNDGNVQLWIEEYIDQLEREIKNAQVEEERES